MRLARAAVAGAAVLVVGGGGWAAYAESSSPGASYRTAPVTTGDVSQTLALSGTLSPAGRRDLAFTTSGTVASVRVGVGDHVKAGQVLARLDRTSLTAAVTRAQAQLDAAQARLASDEDAQTSAASSSSSPSSTPTARPSSSQSSTRPSSAPSSGAAGGTDQALVSRIRQQQTAVTTSQTAASGALATAQAALAAEQQACAASASSSAIPSAASSADPSGSAGTTGQEGQSTSTASPSATNGSACDDAIDAVQTAQTKVDQAQRQLQEALDTLGATLTSAAQGATAPASQGASKAPPSQARPSATPSKAASSSQGSGGSSGSGGTGRTVTAATLASDQASIDSARASLITAQQSLAGAVLRATHSGTIGAVDIATGDATSAGTTAAVLISPGATDVDLTVTSTQVAKLKVGQAAEVTPAGATKPLSGTITRITPVPDSNGNYPVTVTLDQDGLDLPAGGTAAVDVVVAQAHGVLTVPTSAVSNGAVEVLDGTTVTRTRVTIGVVGATRTQVTGLKAGEQVVLADIDAAVPTSDQQSNRFGRLGGANFGGGFTSFGGPAGAGPAGAVAVPKG